MKPNADPIVQHLTTATMAVLFACVAIPALAVVVRLAMWILAL